MLHSSSGAARVRTFLNCMTRFMRLLVAEAGTEPDCSRSSIRILFFTAWYIIFWRDVSGQYTRISI